MGRTAEYQTRQKQQIIDYLNDHRGDYVTAGELAEHFHRTGESVGLTTVYRHLERLVAENKVEKYHIDGMKSACFCAVDEAADETQDNLTMKCQSCGDIVHFSCPDLSHLYAHFAEEHRISIDPRKTVFYGKCDKCSVPQAAR
ncbi:MAG: transcriptional repressor [Lachnospiraceae bacterium]|nr:transcriptional repressor [Lachnospiraceae bacterium]